MFQILLDGILGAFSGLLGILVARLVVDRKTKPRLHLFVFLLLTIIGFQTSSMLLKPRIVFWKSARDVDAFLREDPLFSRVLTDNPTLREPLRAAMLDAYVTGDRERATSAGRDLFTSVFPKYLPRASDEAILHFTERTVYTLRTMAARDAERCYQFLFPNGRGSPRLTEDEGQTELLAAMREVVESADANPTRDADNTDTTAVMQTVGSRLAEKYGDEVSLLQRASDPDVDHAKVCNMSIALYAEILTFPSDQAGSVLRSLYGQ